MDNISLNTLRHVKACWEEKWWNKIRLFWCLFLLVRRWGLLYIMSKQPCLEITFIYNEISTANTCWLNYVFPLHKKMLLINVFVKLLKCWYWTFEWNIHRQHKYCSCFLPHQNMWSCNIKLLLVMFRQWQHLVKVRDRPSDFTVIYKCSASFVHNPCSNYICQCNLIGKIIQLNTELC